MRLDQVLSRTRVEFVIVAGFAGTLHGSSVPMGELDIVYSSARSIFWEKSPVAAIFRRGARRGSRRPPQPLMKVISSSLTISLCVMHRPCGAPL